MRLGEHMCIIPFNVRSRGRKGAGIESEAFAYEGEVGKRGPEAVRTRSKKRAFKHDVGRQRKAKLSKNSKGASTNSSTSRSRNRSRNENSDRITFSRLVGIFKEAYITTMSSFANKPGGLGGITMGGNINLPDATPTRTFKEPRDFVRSWSKRRPDYISSPAPDYLAKGPERDFAQRILPSH